MNQYLVLEHLHIRFVPLKPVQKLVYLKVMYS
jgi:hypothetical protein